MDDIRESNMSELTHVSNSLPLPAGRRSDMALCPPPLPPPHLVVMRHTVENQPALLPLGHCWRVGWEREPQINILFILPLKPTSQEPAYSFPLSTYTSEKAMIS